MAYTFRCHVQVPANIHEDQSRLTAPSGPSDLAAVATLPHTALYMQVITAGYSRDMFIPQL